ncbi:MAG: hypothetical protein ABF289_07300 [Clostridiales bacterium]
MKKFIFIVFIFILTSIMMLSSCSDNSSNTKTKEKSAEKKEAVEKVDINQIKTAITDNKLMQQDSYSLKCNTLWKDAEQNETNNNIEISRDKKNNIISFKNFIDNEADSEVEIIRQDQKTWIKMMGEWYETESTEEIITQVDELSDIYSQIASGLYENYEYIGAEDVNGVNCNKFSIDGTYNIKLPTIDNGIDTEELKDIKLKGNIYISTDDNLKDVIMKVVYKCEGKMINPYDMNSDEAKDNIFEVNVEVSSINEEIKIEIPENAEKMDMGF